jgi:hypothetical protein
VKKWLLLIIVISFQLKAQDTIRFTDGKLSAVKVAEIGLEKIKYNRMDNLTGPVYVVDKSEVKYIKYANGSVDSFAVKKPVVESSPGYVNHVPVEKSFERINIINKRLYYEHHGLNERGLLDLISDYPDHKTKTIMLREFSKLKTYKNNRLIGLAILSAGILASVIGSSARTPGVFLGGTIAGITGSVISIVNKNKYAKKKVDIARIYNGENNPGEQNYDFR